jgi:hypothetical protein
MSNETDNRNTNTTDDKKTDQGNTPETKGKKDKKKPAKKVPSLQKYTSDLIELMRRKKKLQYILEHHDKTEPIVIENIRRYFGGLNEDMRELKRQVETASNMITKVINKPAHADIVCEMAIDELSGVIKTLEGYANPI